MEDKNFLTQFCLQRYSLKIPGSGVKEGCGGGVSSQHLHSQWPSGWDALLTPHVPGDTHTSFIYLVPNKTLDNPWSFPPPSYTHIWGGNWSANLPKTFKNKIISNLKKTWKKLVDTSWLLKVPKMNMLTWDARQPGTQFYFLFELPDT